MKKIAHTLYDKPWKHMVAALVAIILAYAAVSWAIDSGRLLAYFATFVLLLLAINHVIKASTKDNAR